MKEPLLTIENLTTYIPTSKGLITPVNDVGFSVYPGETFALVGESGSGKSLTALSILQLLPSDAYFSEKSRILCKGHDLLSLTEHSLQRVRGRRIGIIFQEPLTALNPVLTIGYQINEVLKKHLHLNHKRAHARTLELLEQVGIGNIQHCRKAYPHQLSGGQRQRVCIAMALAAEPEILIADEPTTALDVTIQAQILHLLKDILREKQMGLLLITHDLAIVKKMANTIGVMHEGKMIEKSNAAEFFAGPKEKYSQQLLAAALLQRKIEVAEEKTKSVLTASHLQVYLSKKKWWQKTPPKPILNDINFTLHEKETLALVGESGSGKTTLAKTLLRFVPLTQGTIKLNQAADQNIQTLSPQQQAKFLQIVWQDPYSSLDPRQSVEDILSEALMVAGKLNKIQKQKAIQELLDQVQLPRSSALRYPHQFSGGQRQRIAIARALAANPKILICDEPTSALDVSVQEQILNLLKDLQQQKNIAYLLITHNMAIVEYLADTVAVLHRGEIVEYGPASQVLSHPVHPYTQLLWDSVPKLSVNPPIEKA